MLQAIEAIINLQGEVCLSEPLQLQKPMRAVLTLLEPIENKGNIKPILTILHSPLFANAPLGNPTTMEKTIQANRNAWD